VASTLTRAATPALCGSHGRPSRGALCGLPAERRALVGSPWQLHQGAVRSVEPETHPSKESSPTLRRSRSASSSGRLSRRARLRQCTQYRIQHPRARHSPRMRSPHRSAARSPDGDPRRARRTQRRRPACSARAARGSVDRLRQRSLSSPVHSFVVNIGNRSDDGFSRTSSYGHSSEDTGRIRTAVSHFAGACLSARPRCPEPPRGVEPLLAGSKPAALPLSYGGVISSSASSKARRWSSEKSTNVTRSISACEAR
jgi:hypothetical protein